MKYATPAMQQHIKVMAKDMFAILHKYAAAGLSKGDNFDLVVAAFKVCTVGILTFLNDVIFVYFKNNVIYCYLNVNKCHLGE